MPSDLGHLTDRARLIEEITQCAGLGAAEVEQRFAAEEAELGWNVRRDVAHFGVTPHRHDAAMQRLYEQGDGFIFETLQYWRKTDRQAWSLRGLQRLAAYCEATGRPRESLKLLMLGDGTGSDTLLLLQAGFSPHYFDVPGSRTSAFSRSRFARRGVASRVRIINDYATLLQGDFEALWCFDVLEHLPDLPAAVGDLGRMLAPGGIALITESCEHVREDLPTHLEINRQYAGRIAELFHAAGLDLVHYTTRTDYRPTEYRKRLPRQWLQALRSRLLRRRVGRSLDR